MATEVAGAVHESPILFSGPMVRAILADRKTQTRRVVTRTALKWLQTPFTPAFVASRENDLSPYGYAGDELWVRETWNAQLDWPNAPGEVETRWWHELPAAFRGWKNAMRVHYNADLSEWQCMFDREAEFDGFNDYLVPTGERAEATRWVPSIHMPRWASRLSLLISDLRIERLNECSEADAIAEGLQRSDGWWLGADHPVKGTPKVFEDPRQAFASRWDDLNAERGYSWNANPWVWVITFVREA